MTKKEKLLLKQIIQCLKRGYKRNKACKTLRLDEYELKKILKKAEKRKLIKSSTWRSLKLEYYFNESLFKEIRKYIRQLYTVIEISKFLHIAPSGIWQILKMARTKGLIETNKIKHLQKVRFNRKIFGKISTLLKKDFTKYEICKKLKIHPRYFKIILKKAKQKKLIKNCNIKALRNEILPHAKEKRILRVQKLYYQLGTLERVAKKMHLTRERVRQILKCGEKHRLFKYELAKHTVVQNLTKKVSADNMRRALATYRSTKKIRSIYDLSKEQFVKLLKIYNLNNRSIRNSASSDKDLIVYSDIVRELGHHPTTTEMGQKNDWRNLWRRLYNRYGSMDNFRKQYGIPIPPKGYSKFKEVVIPKFREAMAKIKKEKRESIINLLKESKRPLCQTEVVKIGNLSYTTAAKHLSQLVKEGMVTVKKAHPKLLYELNRNTI